MAIAALLWLCLACTGDSAAISPLLADVSHLPLHTRLERPDTLQALAAILLASSPAACWQVSGAGHGSSSLTSNIAVGSRGDPHASALLRVGDGLEANDALLQRRPVLVGFAAAAASLCTARSAWAYENRVSKITVKVDGEEKSFDCELLDPQFADGFTLPIKDITGETYDKFFWQDLKEQGKPFKAGDMKRLDESDDGFFYSDPRFVYHIDEGAMAALTNYYQTYITKSKLDVLDICSSWVSHYPKDFKERMNSVVGTGMNPLELSANSQLTSWVAKDLNKEPQLPFPDSSFDIVTCVVSVDYLNQPLKVFKEVNRVLKPGGRFIISQSDRMFFSKAVAVWTGSAMDDRLRVLGKYFQYAGGFTEMKAFDASAKGKNVKGRKARDPMYIVEAAKA